MTQPNNFGFGEEAALLKESARKFFADNFPTERLHAMAASDHNPERMTECHWDTALWQQLVELGWTMRRRAGSPPVVWACPRSLWPDW